MDLHLEGGQILVLPSLSWCQYLGGRELSQVLVIRDHLDLVGLSFQVNSPMSKSFDDCEEFLVVDFVVELRRRHLSRKIRDGPQLSFVVSLAQACSDSFVGCIRFYRSFLGWVKYHQDGFRGEARLQFLKRSFSLCCPLELLIFLRHLGKRCSYRGVPLDELSVEVRKTQKRLDFLDGCRLGPAGDGFNLLLVHFQPSSRYDVSEELDFLFMELCLLRLDAEVCIL